MSVGQGDFLDAYKYTKGIVDKIELISTPRSAGKSYFQNPYLDQEYIPAVPKCKGCVNNSNNGCDSLIGCKEKKEYEIWIENIMPGEKPYLLAKRRGTSFIDACKTYSISYDHKWTFTNNKVFSKGGLRIMTKDEARGV